MAREEVTEGTEEKMGCVCPFCEGNLEMPAPWCTACGAQVRFCASCEEPLPKDATVCSSCGTECEE